MELNTIGLDRIQLSNIAVLAIDVDYLVELKNTGHSIKLFWDEDDSLHNIRICDNCQFHELTIGWVRRRYDVIEYAHLTVTVSNVRGNNWENLSWTEYNSYISKLIQYIFDTYRIELGMSHAKLRTCEINCNLLLDHPYGEYDRVIRLMMSFLPRHLRLIHAMSCTDNPSDSDAPDPTYKRENDQMSVTVYNKSQQMEGKGNEAMNSAPDCDVMRIEIELKNSKKIRAMMFSDFWSQLDDARIRRCFFDAMNTMIIKKFDAWLAQRQRELTRRLVQLRTQYPKTWHHLIMEEVRNKSEIAGVPYILDLDQVIDALSSLPDPHHNRRRAIRSLEGIEINNDVYKQCDCHKAHELMEKIAAAYDNTGK